MATEFERIIGPRADVNELEYISFLHQTGAKFTRKSGAISALDIRRYLRSRYGLDISVSDSFDIVQSLGAGGYPPQPDRIDLVQQKMAQERGGFSRFRGGFSRFESMVQHPPSSSQAPSTTDEKLQESINFETDAVKLGTKGRKYRQHNLQNQSFLMELLSSDNQEHVDFVGSSLKAKGNVSETMDAVASPSFRKEKKQIQQLDDKLSDLQALLGEMLEPKMMYLDIVQMTSMLLIPTIARYGQEWTKTHSFALKTDRVKERIVDPPMYGESGPQATDDPVRMDGADAEILRSFTPDVSDPLSPDDSEDASPKVSDPNDSEELFDFILCKLLKLATKTGRVSSSVYSGSAFVMSSTDSPLLDKSLVETLMVACGLHDRATDSDLLERMVDVARTPSGCLDVRSLVAALTSDIEPWHVDNEMKESTYACDIFGPDGVYVFQRAKGNTKHSKMQNPTPSDHVKHINDIEIAHELEDGTDVREPPETPGKKTAAVNDWKEELPMDVSRIGMAKGIDFVVDAFNSFFGLVLIWAVYISYAGSYAALVMTLPAFQFKCDPLSSQGEAFGCVLSTTILSWLIIAIHLVVFGMIGKQ